MSHINSDCTKFIGHGIIPDFLVPNSFVDDGASIPKIAEPIVGKGDDPKFKSAARGHDWFYRGNHSNMELIKDGLKWTIAIRPSRRQADNWFLKELADNGVGRVRRTLMYVAVRLFAGPFWRGRSDDMDFDMEAIKEVLCPT
jgi:hypothetical protein